MGHWVYQYTMIYQTYPAVIAAVADTCSRTSNPGVTWIFERISTPTWSSPVAPPCSLELESAWPRSWRPWHLPPWRSKWWLLLSESTVSGLVVPFCLLSAPSSRCGSPKAPWNILEWFAFQWDDLFFYFFWPGKKGHLASDQIRAKEALAHHFTPKVSMMSLARPLCTASASRTLPCPLPWGTDVAVS